MKNKYILLLVTVMFVSCSNQDLSFLEFSTVNETQPLLIDEDSLVVTRDNVNEISDIFWNRLKSNNNSRANQETKIIESLEAISNEEGIPLAYIVNYQDNGGFIIISASREYHPILAYSDCGSYNQNAAFGPIKEYLNGHILTIDNIESISLEDKQTYMNEWIAYSKKVDGVYSRANAYIPRYEDAKRQAMRNWKLEGKSFTPMKNSNIEFLPESIRKEYLERAKGYILQSANQEDYAMIVWKTTIHVTEKSLSLTSEWEQGNTFTLPYGGISAPLVGCSPLAMGMVMRYFEWPATYNWLNMLDQEGTSESRQLLRDIGILAGTEYGTSQSSTGTTGMKYAFDKMGYSYNYESRHSKEQNRASIDNNSPVVIIGTGSTGNRHAWICDGYKIERSSNEFEFYVLHENGTDELWYESIGDFESNGLGGDWEHFNWGYHGRGNGWYLNDFTSVVIDGQTMTFDQERVEFRNINPVK